MQSLRWYVKGSVRISAYMSKCVFCAWSTEFARISGGADGTIYTVDQKSKMSLDHLLVTAPRRRGASSPLSDSLLWRKRAEWPRRDRPLNRTPSETVNLSVSACWENGGVLSCVV